MTSELIATFDGLPAHIGAGFNRPASIRIFPGLIEFAFNEQKMLRQPARSFTQQGGVLRVNYVFFPPWLNTVLFLHDNSGLPIYASFPPWQRRRLRCPLAEAGFQPVVKRRVLMGAVE